MTEPSHAIFLSYASQDAEAAQRICEALRAAGIEVWFDQSELRGGDAWDHKIRQQIRDCALFLPIISRNTQARAEGYFRLEWRLADQRTHLMGRSRAFLVPVCIDATREVDADVPDSFSASQWTRLLDGQASGEFVEHIQCLLSPEASPTVRAPASGVAGAAPAIREPGRGPWRLKTVTLTIVAVIALAMGYLVLDRVVLPKRHAAATFDRLAHSIAVLPFVNMSGDKEQEYLSEGLTEALTTDLGKLSALRVISRTSTVQFKGTKKSVPEIARQLGVDVLVQGAVLRSGDRVRVTAQLIEAPADRHVWAETYDRDVRDVLTLQADLAREIAVHVRGKLSSASAAHAQIPLDPDVYELYLKGRYARDEGSEDSLKLAFEYFQQALERDPHYAPAYAGLAACYARLPFYSETPPEAAFPRAKAAAQKALALDATLAEAHASMAYVKTYYDWDWQGAEQEFKKALALNPNYAEAHHSYSRFLVSVGRVDEARVELKRAQDLDPLSLVVQANEGIIFYFGRQYEQAIQKLQAVIDLDPKFFVSYWGVGLCYEQLGRYEEAVAELQKAIDLSGRGANGIASLGHAYGLAGRRSDAQKILAELKERSTKRYVSSYQLAVVYLGLQQTHQAMDQLEKAYQERSTLLPYLRMDPRLDPLRSDPRFRDLLRRMGLPESP